MRILLLFSLLTLINLITNAQSSVELEIAQRYEENIIKEEINGTYIPIDINEAMNELDKLASPSSRAKIVEGEEMIVTERLTKGLGKWMIVHWNFVEGSRLSHAIRQRGVTHPEDMSAYIIGTYYRYLKGEPLDLESRAEAFYNKRKREQEQRNRNKSTVQINK